MSRPKPQPNFAPGDEVRVRRGVCDPDFADVPIGGWAGVVKEIYTGEPPTCLVRWNRRTLEGLHPIYRNRCERDGLDFEVMCLRAADLEPDGGEPLEIERPEDIRTRPLDMADQDDRVRAAFGLTGDDPLPTAETNSLRTYGEYLAGNLLFPFEAEWERDAGPFSSGRETVQATGLGDLDEDFRFGDGYGLICDVRIEGRAGNAPLAELAVARKGGNRTLIDDYRYWFWNW